MSSEAQRRIGALWLKLAGSLQDRSDAFRAPQLAAGLAQATQEASGAAGSAICLLTGGRTFEVIATSGASGLAGAGSRWALSGSCVERACAGQLAVVVPPEQGDGAGFDGALASSGLPAVCRPLRPIAPGATACTGALLLLGPERSEAAGQLEPVLAHLVSMLLPAAGSDVAVGETFLDLLVHELRVPLSVVSGYMDMVREGMFGELSPELAKPLTTVAAKIQETQRLIDDILLLTRLESAAGVPSTPVPLDLNEVVLRGSARAEPRARLAGTAIETRLAKEPVTVTADRFQVDRIVDNLVNNAISYGGTSPWVRLSVDAGDAAAIRVEDRGVGVPPPLQQRIFERSFRVDDTGSGAGFGLHLSRLLAESAGGALELERSVPGEGSCFVLRLPRPASAELQGAAAGTRSQGQAS